MKTVEIKISNSKEYYKLKEQSLLNHNFNKKVYILNLLLFALGVIFLVIGIISGYDFKEEILKNGITKITYYNYYFHIGVGIALIIVSILRILEFLRGKKKIKNYFNLEFKQLLERNSFLTFEVNDKNIRYQDKFKEIKVDWNYFMGYKVNNESIELYKNNFYNINPEFVIPIKEIDMESQEIISDLLKRKLRRMK